MAALHVITGVHKASDLSDGQSLVTISGARLTVSLGDGTVSFTAGDGANVGTVLTADLMSCSGVLHIIDTVLTPAPGTPDAGTPDEGTPDAGTPDEGTPDEGTPDAGTPDEGTPDEGTPDEGIPDAGTPDEGIPDEGIPDAGIPDEGTPDEGTPDAGTPDEGTPDEGIPDEGTPDAGTPDEGTPDAGTPDEGTPDEGIPEEGTPDGGSPDAGTPGDCSSLFFIIESTGELGNLESVVVVRPHVPVCACRLLCAAPGHPVLACDMSEVNAFHAACVPAEVHWRRVHAFQMRCPAMQCSLCCCCLPQQMI